MAIIYTDTGTRDAHGTDCDPAKTTKIYNAFDSETGISKRIEILATTPEDEIQAALEDAYNES